MSAFFGLFILVLVVLVTVAFYLVIQLFWHKSQNNAEILKTSKSDAAAKNPSEKTKKPSGSNEREVEDDGRASLLGDLSIKIVSGHAPGSASDKLTRKTRSVSPNDDAFFVEPDLGLQAPPPCEPGRKRIQTALLDYEYEHTICDPKDPRKLLRVVRCDEPPQNRAESFSLKWHEEFPLALTDEKWPSKVLSRDGLNCITPLSLAKHSELATSKSLAEKRRTNGYILRTDEEGAVMPLAWSPAMSAAHPFNLTTMQYKCSPGQHRYRWSYQEDKLYALPEEEGAPAVLEPLKNINIEWFVESGAPCQERKKTAIEMPWRGLVPVTGYPRRLNAKLAYNIPCSLQEVDYTWPVFLPAQQRYQADIVSLSPKGLLVTRVTDTVPPIGFQELEQQQHQQKPNKDESSTLPLLLDLKGYKDLKGKVRPETMWYFVATGNVGPVEFAPSTTQQTLFTLSVPALGSVTLNGEDLAPVRTLIWWHCLPDPVHAEKLTIVPGWVFLSTSGLHIKSSAQESNKAPVRLITNFDSRRGLNIKKTKSEIIIAPMLTDLYLSHQNMNPTDKELITTAYVAEASSASSPPPPPKDFKFLIRLGTVAAIVISASVLPDPTKLSFELPVFKQG